MTKSRTSLTPLTPLTPEQIQREIEETRTTLPIFAQLAELFTDSKMFRSFNHFSAAGFSLVDHAPYKIMAGRHKRAPGYLFKKFDNDWPSKKQLGNYMHRIEGSRLLRSFIAEQGFSRVMAPKKWLYGLSARFPARYLLVVEKVDLVSRGDTEAAYSRISKKQLHEMATILYYFRGLNSTASNLPFAEDGKIAFIDTERWHHDKDFLRKVGDRLSSSRLEQAAEIYKTLKRQGARPFVSAFR